MVPQASTIDALTATSPPDYHPSTPPAESTILFSSAVWIPYLFNGSSIGSDFRKKGFFLLTFRATRLPGRSSMGTTAIEIAPSACRMEST